MAEARRDMADPGVKATVRVAIPYLAGVVAYAVCLSGAQRTFPGTWFYRIGPGSEPPWYFIGSDLTTALWCFVGALVFTAFVAATARKLGPTVWPALGIMLISFADPIGRGVNILLHTNAISDQGRATSDWPTFDSYLRSQNTASYLSLGVAAVLMAWLIVRYRRALKVGLE